MTKKLNSIQKILKNILKNKYSDEYVYGLPIFYIQKGHNEYLKILFDSLSIKNQINNYDNYFHKIFKYLKTLFFSKKKNVNKNIFYKNFDTFLISNIISDTQIDNDYIFGNLSEYLNSTNIKTLTIFKNFTENSFSNTKFKFKQPFLILSKSASLIKEISFIFGIFFSYRSLLKIKNSIRNKRSLNFLIRSIKFKNLTPIVSNLRLAYQIVSLVKIYNPKLIIFPFENHAWERFLINKLKKMDIKITTAGYQFSTFSKNQFSSQTVLKKSFNPDFIFTSGLSTYNYLNNIFKKKIKLINFGTYKYLEKTKKKKNFNVLNFLMVPEAPLGEVHDFLNIGEKLAKMYPRFNFFIRLHPMSKSLGLIKEINETIKKYNNLKLSKNTLEQDFSNCSYILYRSSSLCVAGCLKGLLPIYIINNGFNLDPFFEINKKFFIKSPNNLKSIVKMSSYHKNLHFKKIKNYSLNYFQKKSKKEVLKLFNNFNDTMI